MAHTTLAVLSSPNFPQTFIQSIDAQIRRVTEIYDEYFPVCVWESPETSRGACDGGYPCGAKAKVTDLVYGPMCVKHFEAVNRG